MRPIMQLVDIMTPPRLSLGVRLCFWCSAVVAGAIFFFSKQTLVFILAACLSKVINDIIGKHDDDQAPIRKWLHRLMVLSIVLALGDILTNVSFETFAYADGILLVALWGLAISEKVVVRLINHRS